MARFGSVFVPYFFDGPTDRFEDLLANDTRRDVWFRRTMAERGVFMVPTALKRMWEAGDRPAHGHERVHKAEFLGRVRVHAVLPDDAEAERAVRAVFGALQRLLGSRTGLDGEAWDIFSQLPKDLKALWVESAGGS